MNSKRKFMALAIIVIAVIAARLIITNKPEIKRKPAPRSVQMSVEVMTLQAQQYQVTLSSYGVIAPRTQGEVKSQVSGQVVYVSEHFRAGAYFDKDEILLKIDPRDYETQIQIARASLASAEQLLIEEKARSQQALDDWRRLGNDAEPSVLVLRKPQLQAAEASVTSASATLSQAKLNLSRTIIRAPYAGRIITIHVDIGQVINSGVSLAEIFSTDAIEVRLPLKNQDLRFVHLPENYRIKQQLSTGLPRVIIESQLAGHDRWEGKITRTESAIDQNSQQLHVVATINDPYGARAIGKQPLKIGQYVNAVIEGKTIAAALIIPNQAIYQGSYVYTVENGLLQRHEIEIDWHNADDTLITAGLEAGMQVVLTPLGQLPSGTAVNIIDAEAATKGNAASFATSSPRNR